jgi:hypothetical protein
MGIDSGQGKTFASIAIVTPGERVGSDGNARYDRPVLSVDRELRYTRSLESGGDSCGELVLASFGGAAAASAQRPMYAEKCVLRKGVQQPQAQRLRLLC